MKTEIKIILNGINKVKEFSSRITKYPNVDIFLKQDKYNYDAHSLLAMFAMNLMKPITLIIYEEDMEIVKSICKDIEEYVVIGDTNG